MKKKKTGYVYAIFPTDAGTGQPPYQPAKFVIHAPKAVTALNIYDEMARYYGPNISVVRIGSYDKSDPVKSYCFKLEEDSK